MTTDNQSEEPLRTAQQAVSRITSSTAAMVRGTGVCETGHKRGTEHYHFDTVHGFAANIARDLMPIRAALAQPTPALDADRLKRAIANIAKRHGLAKDPPIPLSVARIYGYSTAPATMDAEIEAEYAQPTPAPHWPTPPVGPSDESKENPMNDDTRRLLTDLREHLRNCDPLAATQSRGQMAGQVPPSATPHRRAANALRRRLDEALALGGRDGEGRPSMADEQDEARALLEATDA